MSNYLDDAWTAYGAGGGTPSGSTTTDLGGSGSTSSGWGAILGSILGNGSSNGNNQQQSSSSSIFSSPTWSDILKGAQLGYGIIQSKTPPKFANVPTSPDQQKLNDLYFKYMTDPATSNNRAIVSGYARDALNSMHPTWTPPATSTGETGYNGTANRQFSNIPPFDWGKYLSGGGAPSGTSATPSNPTSTQPGATIGGSGVGGPGSGTGVFAPVGSSGDPFANMPNMPPEFTQSVNPSDLASFVLQYGKGALETALGIFSMNPILGGKGAIDLYRSFTSDKGGNQPAGPQDTQQTLSNNPAGEPQGAAPAVMQNVFAPDTAQFFPWQTYGLMYGGGSGGDMFGTNAVDQYTPQKNRKT